MLRILLADDSDASRAITGIFLKGLSCLLEEAVDEAGALALYSREPYGLVLMDLEMPVMDGLAAARAIRDLEQQRGLPPAVILAFTAHDDLEHRRACHDAGCNDILTKPLNRQRLLDAVTPHIPA